MSEAMKLIVDGYVRLGLSSALEDTLNHRRTIASQLQFRSISSEFDLDALMATIDKEIGLIEEGIEKIKNPPAAGAQTGVVQRVTSAQPDEAAGSLIDTVIDLLKKPHEPQIGAVQPLHQDDAVIAETARPGDPVPSDEEATPMLFREASLDGQFTYKWGSRAPPLGEGSGET